MSVRRATYKDTPVIKSLLVGLGHTINLSPLINQVETMFSGNDHQVYVYESGRDVTGFITVHFLPQLAFEGYFAIVSYLLVDDMVISNPASCALAEHVATEAWKRKCDGIQINRKHCNVCDSLFFTTLGYQDYANYYEKKLTPAIGPVNS